MKVGRAAGTAICMRLMLASGFTVFITMDRDLAYQQNIATAGLAVVVLRAQQPPA